MRPRFWPAETATRRMGFSGFNNRWESESEPVAVMGKYKIEIHVLRNIYLLYNNDVTQTLLVCHFFNFLMSPCSTACRERYNF